MAQRTIHYCLGTFLIERGLIHDKDRFLLGTVLPDAYRDPRDRRKAHFQSDRIPGKRFFDFDEFYDRYEEKIREDDLYLGYYLHLLEDDLYRDLFHRRLQLPRMKNDEDVETLHRDYHLLNRIIVEKYDLHYDIAVPDGLEEEELLKILPFDIENFLEEFKKDFHEEVSGECRFISEDMVFRFLDEYRDPVLNETEALRRKERFLKAEDWAWELK